MEWSYHLLIEDKCQYPYKKERTQYFFIDFFLQIHTHENALVLKSTNKVD